jgi:hypothetical protein
LITITDVSPLYLFSEHNLVRTTANTITTMTATNAHQTHKSNNINNNNNNLNTIREGSPSPLTLSGISTNLNDNSGQCKVYIKIIKLSIEYILYSVFFCLSQETRFRFQNLRALLMD